MCRYAFHPPPPHFVCFDCRKGFKANRFANGSFKRNRNNKFLQWSQYKKFSCGKKDADFKFLCPQCAKPMQFMGFDLQTPPMNDKKAWQALEFMAKAMGSTFASCGCDGPGKIPQTLKEAQEIYKIRKKWEMVEAKKILAKPKKRISAKAI